MATKVALVRIGEDVSEACRSAINLLGGIDDLDRQSGDVTIKVGIYDERNLNYATSQVVQAVANSFSSSRRIFLGESDNHEGRALERLQVWKGLFSDRLLPFDLSNDPITREGLVCGEKVRLSHILFKPNVLVSLHVLRKSPMGTVLKNLLGLIPDTRKDRFHDRLGTALVDIAQAVGWIDLAVIDGTYLFGGEWKEGEPHTRERKDLLVMGRDAVAVEVVGCLLAGQEPLSVPAIVVAEERGLGETDISRIEVLGGSTEDLTRRRKSSG